MGALLDVVYIISVRGPSSMGVIVFLFPLDDDPGSPSAWSFFVVVVDVEYPVTAVQSVFRIHF